MIEVCVVGELNLDLILYGLPEELVLDSQRTVELHSPAMEFNRKRTHAGEVRKSKIQALGQPHSNPGKTLDVLAEG